MTTNNRFFTKDYLDSLAFADKIASYKEDRYITWDYLFFGVYKFLKPFSFSSFFWDFIGFKNESILENYFSNSFDIDIEDLSWNNKAKLSLEGGIEKKINKLWEEGITEFNFLVALFVSFDFLSENLSKYLNLNGVDLTIARTKISSLLKNPNISDIGVINLFKILKKIFNKSSLDIQSVDMSIDLEKIDKNMIDVYENMDFDEISNFSSEAELTDDESWGDSYISSESKQENQKLTIEYFGNDLTKEAKENKLDPIIGREKEINQTIYTLLRKTKNNPLLIWEAGVGKTAIVEWLSQKIIADDVPEKLKNKRIFVLDMWSLLAWTKYRWEFEVRLKTILEEATDPVNNIIMFIDELHTIVGAGNVEWSADASNMLKPLLAKGKIQLIGSTTFDEYQKYIEKDPALKRRFQETIVEEPSINGTIEILKWLRERFEDYHGVNITDEAIKSSVDMTVRYVMNNHLPDKAIDILDEACARKSTLNDKLKNNDEYKKLEKQVQNIQNKIEKNIQKQDYFSAAELKEEEEKLKQKMKDLRYVNVMPKHLRLNIESEDVAYTIWDKLGLPIDKVTKSEMVKLKELENKLKKYIFGQDEAVNAVVKAIRRNRISVVEKTRPIASFLFLWPSGVGKTYLAKLLASEFFWGEKSLIRFDMSEYMEKHSVSKLTWSAPGYVGYEEWGVLTEEVRRKPYSVVLLDEIEKASPEVLNILLQIMDEWRIKDNKWRLINFRNTILILTSNIGSEEFGKKLPRIGFQEGDSQDSAYWDFEETKERVLEETKSYLSPEMLNRLDKNIVFNSLSRETLYNIFRNKLSEFLRLWKEKENIKVPRFTKYKIKKIIDEIYNPEYGARPIERYIYDNIEPELIDQLMNSSYEKKSAK